MTSKVPPHVLLSPAAVEYLDRVKFLVCICTLGAFFWRHRFVCLQYIAHVKSATFYTGLLLAAEIISGLCWDAFFLPAFKTLVHVRIQVYTELDTEERQHSHWRGQQEEAGMGDGDLNTNKVYCICILLPHPEERDVNGTCCYFALCILCPFPSSQSWPLSTCRPEVLWYIKYISSHRV